jgi:outer membrane immunogenic protein
MVYPQDMKSFAVAVFALLPLALTTAPAFADGSLTIPPLKVDPNPAPSMWNGFYVGTGVTFAAIKGQKGGFGGDVYAGYDHEFQNNLVLGVQFDTGYAPFASTLPRFNGFNYAMGSVKVGYDFGRITPFVYAGGGLARATAFSSGLPDAASSLNGAFGQGPGFGVAEFGAGFDYHVTNNVTVSVSAGVMNGPPGAGF